MATLIPALGSCASRMTGGERRLAERLEHKLDDDYLLWYDVPVGPKQSHPDFVVLHPRRGLLILETKDWKLETIRQASRQAWEIVPDGKLKVVMNPLAQARHCAIQVVEALERDAQLIHHDGPHRGKLAFPWGHGVVLTRITRKQFADAGLDHAIEPHLVICSDEMPENVDAERFQQRLWGMFPHAFGHLLSLPQLDRVRWIMFPEVRVQRQGALFDDTDRDTALPDLMQVMDLQQEQLARSLGDGHRVIHGVAGSGKTMILGYRAELLAKAATRAKPVLVLCFNEPLAVTLQASMAAKGIDDRVLVRHFHKWCREQLVRYHQTLPADGPGFHDRLVEAAIRAVDRAQIPAGQYQAILIDEGHDFRPEWLKLVTQMVDPASNSLLLLYDDAQNIYERRRSRHFSFKSVGVQAQGRTSVLKINYRNTRQILRTASLIAADLLTDDQRDDDSIPMLRPVSCGRDGRAPLVIRLPSLRDEAFKIAELLAAAQAEGRSWSEMAILAPHRHVLDECAAALTQRRMPYQLRRGTGTFDPAADSIKLLTMHASKGLEFPVVALAGVGRMPDAGKDEGDEALLLYVAATRATHTLYITLSGSGAFATRLTN
ncbi:MAG TPA: 3'-5' exonuclease [Burkholderiaceae bacterium]|nr:3'-5' exonuclease [Burkholderiaceae bacterium]